MASFSLGFSIGWSVHQHPDPPLISSYSTTKLLDTTRSCRVGSSSSDIAYPGQFDNYAYSNPRHSRAQRLAEDLRQ